MISSKSEASVLNLPFLMPARPIGFGEQDSERRRIASLAWVQHLRPPRRGQVFAKLSNRNNLAFDHGAARAMLMHIGTRRTLRSTRSHISARLITPKGGSPLRPAFFFALDLGQLSPDSWSRWFT